MDTEVVVQQYDHLCRRCRKPYTDKYRRDAICPSCKQWLKDTMYTHCHNKACDDPDNPTKFDRVKDTKYGREYHCSKCGAWINFGLLADIFSIERSKK